MTVRTVAIAIHDGVQALDVVGPMDVFHEANAYLATGDRYETVLVAADDSPLRASNSMQLRADLTFAEATGTFDILLIAGGPALPDAPPDPRLIEWASKAPNHAHTYGSICTGVFALGYAGLIDQRRVTTHWQNVPKLAARFPNACVEPDAIYVRDDRLVTSAGVTAGIDLALALVGQCHGQDIALTVAKRLVVVAQRQGGQSQFSPYLTAPANPASPVARIQAHVMTHIGERHSLESLAAEVGMSARNLARYFVQETGITPHEFVQRARIDAARMMLEASDRPLKTIAYDCGFGTVDRMRITFGERLGITPAQYRASFRRQAPASSTAQA
ncbi:DJ-1/PfpI family protein [Pseudomonas guariconensis]|uniref:GlxA family transcriptional regulator n=1 Tax=Pseudomonas TaxID=286 RepID=UPI001CE4ABD5|nr:MULTISPECIES: DJ-1/PfpI family protein [Pseudomonas]MCO7638753.1 DJ-1/PfpI family protein [Pseudomonas sp. S 311-6]MCO7514978.1 DJ-1/PfpI family protein [Pseudomonas putida]MCO7564474.1 DJ-1/PfpI family protein [Pseudomonas mosselii]MCO7595290.1 DJ-1/PfpI family protein [Pseudomonas guariconensis]MCO7604205.1 DJ-1/PfpI family protein [Pseudomonas guariconensis]